MNKEAHLYSRKLPPYITNSPECSAKQQLELIATVIIHNERMAGVLMT